MKQTLRAFATGLLTATLIIAVIYFIEKDDTEDNKAVNLTTKQMKQALESQGYTISLETNKDEQEQVTPEPNDSNQADQPNEQNSKPKEVRIYTLTIESGMTISEIAEILADAKIIKSTRSFISYLQDHEYGTNIQVGQFELTDQMTLEQISRTIANKN
ncbi:endolytic transglycosylase MltG [Paraliobacillus sp. JSM ZJ581]|uniref:endolytic transglycosylase MltG n=1 Tax=Paraliobacillus sp. JSM ZJ581 TaxID=3342118 RepID=UPI0035A9A5EC